MKNAVSMIMFCVAVILPPPAFAQVAGTYHDRAPDHRYGQWATPQQKKYEKQRTKRVDGVVTEDAVTSYPPENEDPNYWTEERMRNARPMEKTIPGRGVSIPYHGRGINTLPAVSPGGVESQPGTGY